MNNHLKGESCMSGGSPSQRFSIEWGLLFFVLFVEMTTDFLWNIFLAPLIYEKLPGMFPNVSEFWGGLCLLFVFAIVKGIIAGLVTVKCASSRKYLHTLLTGTVAAFTPMLWVALVSMAGLSWHEDEEPLNWLQQPIQWFQVGIWAVTVVLSAFYGVYMAQSFERTRGVQID